MPVTGCEYVIIGVGVNACVDNYVLCGVVTTVVSVSDCCLDIAVRITCVYVSVVNAVVVAVVVTCYTVCVIVVDTVVFVDYVCGCGYGVGVCVMSVVVTN